MGDSDSAIVVAGTGTGDLRFVRGTPSVGRGYRKSDIEEKLDFLYRISDRESAMYRGGDAISDIVSKSLIALYEMCLKYDQTEYPRTYEGGLYRYATRVFKVYASVDPWDLRNIEHVYCNGMYWPLEGAFLSRAIMGDYFESCYRWKSDGRGRKHAMTADEISDLGLPDNLDYLMINRLQNGMGFALRKDSPVNRHIKSRKCFVPLNLNAIG